MNPIEYRKTLLVKKSFVKGQYVDIYAKLKLFRNDRNNGYILDVKIPFPSNYPNTELNESLTHLFEARIILYDTDFDPFKPIFYESDDELFEDEKDINESMYNTSLVHFEKMKEILGMGYIGNLIYIESFYILSRKNNIYERPEEKVMLRGIGKETMCKVLNEILSTDFFKSVNETNSVVLLDSGGGNVITSEDFARHEKYQEMNREIVKDIIKMNYSEYYEEELQEYNDNWDFAITLVSLENNKNLSAYYSNTFGFKVVTYHSLFTPMVTPLYTFLEKCS